jgi:hypothetical protein
MLIQIDLSGPPTVAGREKPPLPRFLSQAPKDSRTARRTIQFFLFHPALSQKVLDHTVKDPSFEGTKKPTE